MRLDARVRRRGRGLEAAQHAAGRTSRLRLSAVPPKAVSFEVEPLAVALDPIRLDLGHEHVDAVLTVRLYDIGAVSLALRVPCRDLAWEAFTARLNAVGIVARSDFWAPILDQLRQILRQLTYQTSRPQLSPSQFRHQLTLNLDMCLHQAPALQVMRRPYCQQNCRLCRLLYWSLNHRIYGFRQ